MPAYQSIRGHPCHDTESAGWLAAMTRAGVPTAIVERLNREINQFLQLPQIRERLAALDIEPAGGSVSDLTEHLRSERKQWAALIKGAGIVLQ